jgi:hypothetical protein
MTIYSFSAQAFYENYISEAKSTVKLRRSTQKRNMQGSVE